MIQLLSKELETHTYIFELTLSLKLPNITAHFPSHMLVPAYMQLGWVEDGLALVHSNLKILEYQNVKFIKEIAPEGIISLSLTLYKPAIYKFSFRQEEVLLSSGTFITNE